MESHRLFEVLAEGVLELYSYLGQTGLEEGQVKRDLGVFVATFGDGLQVGLVKGHFARFREQERSHLSGRTVCFGKLILYLILGP